VITELVMLWIATQAVVTLMEDILLRLNVASVNHVAYTVSEEVTPCLLFTMLFDVNTTVTCTIQPTLPLPARSIKGAGVFANLTHKSINPFGVPNKLL